MKRWPKRRPASHWSHEKYLATLTSREVDRRTHNQRQRRIKEARFPFRKELADFDFDAIPHLNQPRVLSWPVAAICTRPSL
ncbi:MAG: ATP-binding protein [Caldilineaceae bacterium]